MGGGGVICSTWSRIIVKYYIKVENIITPVYAVSRVVLFVLCLGV